MKKVLRKSIVVVMALTMLFAMSVSVFADTTNAHVTVSLYYEGVASPDIVDSLDVQVAENDSIYDMIEDNFGYYAVEWTTGTDFFNGDTVKYLKTFGFGEKAKNVSYQYNSDGSGWSIDWGWIYTVNDTMPTFPNEPNHGMAMNQYKIQENDNIKITFGCIKSTWDANGNTTMEILDPTTVY